MFHVRSEMFDLTMGGWCEKGHSVHSKNPALENSLSSLGKWFRYPR